MRFALLERRSTRQERPADAALETVFATCERVRIGAGVDAATLVTVVKVFGHDSPAARCVGLRLAWRGGHEQEFDSLHAIVRERLELDAFSGHLVGKRIVNHAGVFFGRCRNRRIA